MRGGSAHPPLFLPVIQRPDPPLGIQSKKIKDESPVRVVSGTLFRSFRRTLEGTCFLDAPALQLAGFVSKGHAKL